VNKTLVIDTPPGKDWKIDPFVAAFTAPIKGTSKPAKYFTSELVTMSPITKIIRAYNGFLYEKLSNRFA